MKKYTHIFFDLDRTIWDFDASAADTFARMFIKYELEKKGVPSVEDFRKHYTVHNDRLWELYRKGEIMKNVLNVKRFQLTLDDYGIHNSQIAEGMGRDYVIVNPKKAFLFPFAIESLEYLASKYPLHLITNGFQEVQEQKFNIARLDRFFQTVTTSEEAGIKKPEPGIFHHAMEKASCTAADSIMIGDDLEVDIIGARNIGMDQVFYNTNGQHHAEDVTFEIKSLKELMEIL